jgi:acetoacetyl-CoA synthetase
MNKADNNRSDGVLNPSGVRFGSAEIYAVTEEFPEIDDAICVGQQRPQDADEAVLLFLKMKVGSEAHSEFVQRLKDTIALRYTRRHVPHYIFAVMDIPYTVNGKKCENIVKQVVGGRVPIVSGTVANPECIKIYEPYFNIEKVVQERNLVARI